MIRQTFIPLIAAAMLAVTPAFAQDDSAETESWLPSLITETPEQGFDLAVSIARRAVKTTQPDTDVLHELRPVYSHDADSLIGVSGVVASYFSIVAEANEYWRD